MGQSVGVQKWENPREKKTPGTPASRTWLVPIVAGVGLKPTPDTAMIKEIGGSFLVFIKLLSTGTVKVFALYLH